MTNAARSSQGDDGSAESIAHTTERVTVEEYRGSEGDHVIYSLHAATYGFALPYVSGRDVLDFGCGTGYGTAMLAARARSAVGVDVAAEAVHYARSRFSGKNLTFEKIAPIQKTPLRFPDESFDVVVSFQVIEHIDDVSPYLREVHRVLCPGGVFLCVTPDRTHRLFARQRPWNEFHVTEFAPGELEVVLRSQFSDVRLLGMTARAEIIDHELRRYRRMRLLAYPFTFPGAPEAWRCFGIRAAKRLMGKKSANPPDRTYDFGPGDIVIETAAEPSVNIVAVALREARSSLA